MRAAECRRSALGAILLWSAISAAFIGPGTVTTAAKAGARFGTALMWAVAFSAAACFVLQEASARLTIASGRTLGEALSGRGRLAALAAVAAVVAGCAAYEAGNLLGAAAGLRLAVDLPEPLLALAAGAVALGLLAAATPRGVALALSAAVAVMGLAFFACAAAAPPRPAALLAALVPRVPQGAGTLALALVGTTVVPYNLFLGSGLARGEGLRETRVGLAVSVALGGAITAAILIVGRAAGTPFGYEGLAAALGERLGPAGRWLLAAGLAAAGLSSAVTAPLAAGLAVASVTGERWRARARRLTALGVLVFGLAFGVAGAPPIPVIVLAQALNGLLLPLVALFLALAVSDPRLVGEAHRAGPLGRAALAGATLVTIVLGLRGIAAALGAG